MQMFLFRQQYYNITETTFLQILITPYTVRVVIETVHVVWNVWIAVSTIKKFAHFVIMFLWR